ncbi:hypothetical protein LSH36_89g04037 [Paralvinella palmiformis]|uniref:RRM domain-containing protein n=1 Tax=Paralvinella palmiformis TaxID=53620 RepID=A0AAD9K1S2_9ANNE|nr:hypothetical protein LSH36_89g04037 [Paralvinella palmiformis]
MGTRVYIGRLSSHVRERDVERFFKGYGRIRELMLKNGYGFVAIQMLVVDKGVLIEHARGVPRGTDYRRERMPPRRSRGSRDKYGPPVRTEYRLIVENLSSRVSWQVSSFL